MRPRPGAGRRDVHRAGPAPEPAPPAAGVDAEPISGPARALLGLGLNPLVQAASPLLLLTAQLREHASSMDVAGLRRHALEEIRRFEEQARAAGVPNEVVLAARYALCAGLDEAVLSTPWGAQSEWAQHPLLVALHREAWGGEKFFDMLDRISQDPARHIDLMELQYLVLALGFAGKYQVQERGHEQLAGCAARALSHDPRPSRRRPTGAVAALARTRGPAQSADSLRAVVGRRRGGAGDPRRSRSPSTTRAWPAWPIRCTPSWRRSASKTFRRRRRRRRCAGRRSSSCWRPTKQPAR